MPDQIIVYRNPLEVAVWGWVMSSPAGAVMLGATVLAVLAIWIAIAFRIVSHRHARRNRR